jgi:transposase-like protein
LKNSRFPETTFKDTDGKPEIREERLKAKCPVKGCKGAVERHKAKSDGRLFWKCGACGSYFDDAEGKPVVREKVKSNVKAKAQN